MFHMRSIRTVLKSTPTIEGAGVHLKRAFGFQQLPMFDPFLLLDDFHSNNPDHYLAGFPWHPHRGIETITYVLHGAVEHGDSLGNAGVIREGDVQWMTAGSGIIHQEMPKNKEGNLLWGFQLWANLPASEKMMDSCYRDITNAMIPVLHMKNKIQIRIISGKIEGKSGPVNDIMIEPEYLDVTIPPETSWTHQLEQEKTAFAYVISGEAYFDQCRDGNILAMQGVYDVSVRETCRVNRESIVLYETGDAVEITTADEPVRFLLISGNPLHEPVAWHGPIVMNTREELITAFQEYEKGTFIKYHPEYKIKTGYY